MKKILHLFILVIFCSIFLIACSNPTSSRNTEFDYSSPAGKEELSIVAGSELKDLEPIFDSYAEDSNVQINIDYLGSLDIMNMLKQDPDHIKYDGVWPANSIWLDLGDTNYILKHSEITSISPVAFGIERSKAEELGFVGSQVGVQDIITAIEDDKLNFGMTSASQSNSGASAYLGFLQALDPTEESNLTTEDLDDPVLQDQITTLLSGVNRASGSSGWLRDLYLEDKNLNAMVNYEAMILSVNHEMLQGNNPHNKEELYIVYPYDGLTFSDSPLAFIDKSDNGDKEEIFLDFQEYMLSDQVQEEVQKYGRRTAYNNISNPTVFKEEWGVDIDTVLTPIMYPEPDAIMKALNLYQTSFKKPAYTVYLLDFSGSMYGEGYEELISALEHVFIPENAEKYLLQGTDSDMTLVVPFSNNIIESYSHKGGDLRPILEELKDIEPYGGTATYSSLKEVFEILKDEDLSDYNVSVVVLSDGRAGDSLSNFLSYYNDIGSTIPVFTIATGEADEEELKELSQSTNARFFDNDNLIEAFKKVKGYN